MILASTLRPNAPSINMLGRKDPTGCGRIEPHLERRRDINVGIAVTQDFCSDAASKKTRSDRVAIELVSEGGEKRDSIDGSGQPTRIEDLLDTTNGRTVSEAGVDQPSCCGATFSEFADHVHRARSVFRWIDCFNIHSGSDLLDRSRAF